MDSSTSHRCWLCGNFSVTLGGSSIAWCLGDSMPLSAYTHSAAAGCLTCDIVTRSIRGLLPEQSLIVEYIYRVESWNYSDSDAGGQGYGLSILSSKGRTNLGGGCIEIFRMEGEVPFHWDAIKVALNSYRSKNSSCVESFQWVQRQILFCDTSHDGCIGTLEADLPTRVLDIGQGDDTSIKVIDTGGLKGRYACLSHCWGDITSMPTKLTSHTTRIYHTTGIPITDLPKTFRHAVEFSRKLGIRYLWIDSLCILQPSELEDSDEDRKRSLADWTRESSQMCSIYENSYLTLAAASASGCQEGLFFDPKTMEFEGNFEIEGEQKEYQVYARKYISHRPSKYPLMQRGWVLQETFLSPRTLLFTDFELLWHCRETVSCECRPTGDTGLGWNYGDLKISSGEQQDRLDPIVKWHKIIKEYSSRNLSYQTDKLAAVEGIARWMSRFRTGTYIAGLWNDHFSRDLCWKAHVHITFPKRFEAGGCDNSPWSTDRWLFPTWTWACMKTTVTWDEPRKDDVYTPLVWCLQSPGGSGLESTPRTRLRVRGTLVPIKRMGVLETSLGGFLTFTKDHDDYYHRQYGKGYVSQSTPVYCLRVDRWARILRALVLICVDIKEELYERIGLLEFNDNGQGVYTLPTQFTEDEGFTIPRADFLRNWWDADEDNWIPKNTELTLV